MPASTSSSPAPSTSTPTPPSSTAWAASPSCSARMNADLHMAGDLKAGGGNLFVVFGEPDIELHRGGRPLPRRAAGRRHLQARHRRGRQRPTPDDIACWFIDTDYYERELLRPPRLLPRRRHPLQGAPHDPEGRDRRGRLGEPEAHRLAPVPAAEVGPDRGEGDQPPRRRGDEGDGGVMLTDRFGKALVFRGGVPEQRRKGPKSLVAPSAWRHASNTAATKKASRPSRAVEDQVERLAIGTVAIASSIVMAHDDRIQAPWREVGDISRPRTSMSTLLVAMADKLHNASSDHAASAILGQVQRREAPSDDRARMLRELSGDLANA